MNLHTEPQTAKTTDAEDAPDLHFLQNALRHPGIELGWDEDGNPDGILWLYVGEDKTATRAHYIVMFQVSECLIVVGAVGKDHRPRWRCDLHSDPPIYRDPYCPLPPPPSFSPHAPRPALLWFAEQMKAKLAAHNPSCNWFSSSMGNLVSRIFEDLEDLAAAKSSKEIIETCAGIANYAMMAATWSAFHSFQPGAVSASLPTAWAVGWFVGLIERDRQECEKRETWEEATEIVAMLEEMEEAYLDFASAYTHEDVLLVCIRLASLAAARAASTYSQTQGNLVTAKTEPLSPLPAHPRRLGWGGEGGCASIPLHSLVGMKPGDKAIDEKGILWTRLDTPELRFSAVDEYGIPLVCDFLFNGLSSVVIDATDHHSRQAQLVALLPSQQETMKP